MKWTVKDIEEIIENNPDMTYQDVKKHAIRAGVNLENFNEAWHEFLMTTRKPPASKLWAEVYIVSLAILSLIGFEVAYWHFAINIQNALLQDIIGKTALFFAFILILQLSSKFAGGKASIFSATKLSIFFLFATYLAHFASQSTTTVTYIIILFGGVLLGFFMLFAMASTYSIGAVRTIFMALLCGVMMALVIEFTMGLGTFKGYFMANVKNVQMENVVDIAEEKDKTEKTDANK